MSDIKSVAIAGAFGTFGSHVLKALVDAKFKVKILTRSAKSADTYAGVEQIEVDYASIESLSAALKGIDAVVSTVAAAAIGTQGPLIDAAAIAGVKRFIPSEYGAVTTNPKVQTFPLYDNIFKMRNLLQEKADAGQTTWTVLALGAFLEFLFEGPASIVNFKECKALLLDEGDNRFSANSLAASAEAIAGILKNPIATKNRVVHISQAILTQNQILKLAQKLRPEDQWEIEKVASSAMREEALAGFRAGDFSLPVIVKLILGTGIAGETYGGAYAETDNDLLGIKQFSGDDLTQSVAEKLA
ncbi:NAD(P)-binding protein [Periconia macrospinosa]|uniref:NAD(P)-binding protein n=1 Tax=Periconia macrospinosa TaxID=97972 RepID=A0A2V1DJY7_9PLEO|nr:NAD(P)-binding protein [Periconia macrospinosa]